MSRPDNTYSNANDNEKDDGNAMTANDNNFGSKVIDFGLALTCLSNTWLMHLSELCGPHHNPNFSSRLFQEPRSRISTETFFSFSSQPTPTFPDRLACEARRECGRGTRGANVGVPVFVFAPRKRAEAGLDWGLGKSFQLGLQLNDEATHDCKRRR
jgi:hypothetical protein